MANILLDAVDAIADGRHFVEAVFLASHIACAEQDHRNAIAATCDAADKKLKEAIELVDRVRLAPGSNGSGEAKLAPAVARREPPDFHDRLSDVRTRMSTIELALGSLEEESDHDQVGDVRRQALLAEMELGKLLAELRGERDETPGGGGD
jgi:hypothetical protein